MESFSIDVPGAPSDGAWLSDKREDRLSFATFAWSVLADILLLQLLLEAGEWARMSHRDGTVLLSLPTPIARASPAPVRQAGLKQARLRACCLLPQSTSP
jgi:hypothetical protein